MIRVHKNSCWIIIISYILYAIYMIGNPNEYTIFNFILYAVSVLFVVIGIDGVRKNGIQLCNIFLTVYFSVLALNNFNISSLQGKKTFTDLYFFLAGPLIFVFLLKIYEHTVVFKKNVDEQFDRTVITAIFFIAFIAGKTYIFYKTGIRFISNEWLTSETAKYVIPGLTGLVSMCMWLLLMLIPNVSVFFRAIIVVTVYVAAVLSANRGDLMRISIYLILLWMGRYGKNLICKKNIIIFGCVLLGLLTSFTIWGNYRQMKRGWDMTQSTMGIQLESNSNSNMINWLYGYTAINFDVLKHDYIDKDLHPGLKAVSLPVIRIIHGSEGVDRFYKQSGAEGLNGFNASTFMAAYVYELGPFYFIEIVILGFIILIVDSLCRIFHFKGGHYFLMMETAITIFGNYYLDVNMFFALLTGIAIFILLNFKLYGRKQIIR